MSLILLAGGKGTRLNIDKAFLKFNNKFLIEIIINKLIDLFDEVIIVANNNIEKYNEIIKRYNKIIIKQDLIKDKGPLGGIYTGLSYSKNKNNFVVACDMPFVNINLIKFMLSLNKNNDFDAVIPRFNGFIEPLHAIYSKNNLELIKKQIGTNNLKISDFINKIEKIKYIEEIEKFDKERLCFFNMNNKEDLERARRLVSKPK